MTRRAILVVLFFAAFTSSAHAAEPFAKIGSIYTLLSNPRGVRNIGMGLTGAADVGGMTTGQFNPASLAWVDGATLGWSRQAWEPTLDLEFRDFHATAGYRRKLGDRGRAWRIGGAVSYSTQTSPPMEARTIFLPQGTGSFVRIDEDYGSAIGAFAWEERHVEIGIGGALKYVRTGFGIRGRGWATDVGAVAAFPFDWRQCSIRPRVGSSSTNDGDGITIDDGTGAGIDGEQRVGVGLDVATRTVSVGRGVWRRDVPVFALSVQYDYIDRDRSDEWGAGVELSLFRAFDVRYGRTSVLDATGDSDRDTFGFGLGWEVGRWMARLDYARALRKVFGSDDPDDIYGATIGGRW